MEEGWVTNREAEQLLGGISRVELNRRTKPGAPDFVISRPRPDGKRGLIYWVASFPAEAQRRYRDSKLSELGAPRPEQAAAAGPGQGSFFPEVERDRQTAASIPSQSERDVALRRKRVVDLCLDHNWKAEGYRSKREFQQALALRNQTSVRSIQRWVSTWKERESLEDLVRDRPGPAPGAGSMLDADMRAHLYTEWLQGRTARQCARSLIQYLRAKQGSPGCRVDHVYHLPSVATAERYVRSLSALDDAAREGPDALKAACGHIDRSYRDLASLERVESDECKLNLFSFDPRRAVNRRGEPWVRRYWLLTFYDARSTFPLVWSLCEGNEYELRRGIAVEDEINLFVALLRQFGVPTAIHSDRGRFRGRRWGGEPYQQRVDREFSAADGILQRAGELAGLPSGIAHNMPRVHNPRGSRLERFHRWVADWFRGKPGWVGANTRERKMTRGDADAARHKLWCVGRLAPGERSPLLTRNEVLAEVNAMMEAWRDHNSQGTDMNGLSPRAVFVQNAPRTGFRRISEEDLAWATAEHFKDEHIAVGGIVQLRDGKRYSHPLLLDLAGQKREVVRLRHDDSFITVLPAHKGEEKIVASRRRRVGTHDPDELARQMQHQAKIQKLAGPIVVPLEYKPEAAAVTAAPGPEPTAAAAEAPEPTPDREMSGAEDLMRREGRKPMDFADLDT